MAIIVENINYIYGKGLPEETYALRDVSFTVEDGSFTGIIGHTGSGKSTLIQHLNGLLKPDSGKITVSGCDITSKDTVLRDIRKKVGLVFQYPEYQLFEETVAKDVAYGPKNMGMTEEEIQQRVREALDLVDLPFDEYGSRSPFELSGGQKRRAAIAGVIAMEPEVLILDEPTAGLDPATHRDILDMICRIREQRGTTVIFVSHNMDDIARLCDRVLVMDEGQLVMTGTPAEVFAQSQKLKDIGLGIPEAGELIEAMRRRGAKIGENALFPEEAAEIIGRYFRRQTGADGCVMRADAGDPAADTGARRVVSEAREPDNGADIKMEEPDNSDDRGTETC